MWTVVFSDVMQSIPLGLCMGIAIGSAFGLFEKSKEEG